MTIATKAIGAYCRESGHTLGNLDADEIRGLTAAASAVWDEAVEACARKICSYCAAGHDVRFDQEYGDWIHNSPQVSGEAVECDANAIRFLKHGCHERPASLPHPPSSFEERASATPSAQPGGQVDG